MAWFQRKKAGILTERSGQNEVPEGQWIKCPGCDEIVNRRELVDNCLVCPKCAHHFSYSSESYFRLLFDDDRYEEFDRDLEAVDSLGFVDTKAYSDRLEAGRRKTGLNDAIRSAIGPIGGHDTSVAAMDFAFIGGSMGSVVGEVISRTIKRAYVKELPLIIISQSGGARMMEGALSLMQMAKTSAQLKRYSTSGLPYLSILTNPTTGGVTASFAMLGDIHIAEPGALIGFAGPRVIRETIGQDLPPEFQRAEFLQEKGFVDLVVDRRQLRDTVAGLIDMIVVPA